MGWLRSEQVEGLADELICDYPEHYTETTIEAGADAVENVKPYMLYQWRSYV